MQTSEIPSTAPAPRSPFHRRIAAAGQQAALTICARNYFAQASVLAASFAAQHPEIELFVVLIDERDDAFAARHPAINLVWIEDVGVPGFAQHSARFDIIELSTNVKAFCLLRLLDDFERAIYLDPDIAVYDRLDGVYAALEAAPIVVTPASMTPILDGHQPDDLEWLRVGAFNLGFIGVSAGATATAFLRWWSSRCLSDGFHETPAGVFLDQKWIDLVPCFFPQCRILRDPGLNMAAWNLHERRLTPAGRGYRVNGESTLKFFHFSSFAPDAPRQIARRQTRHAAGQRDDLSALLDGYAQQLFDAGYQQHSRARYSFDYFRSGEYLSPTLRRIFANPAYHFAVDEDPRAAGSSLHRFGVTHGLVRASMQPAARASAGDLRNYQRQVRWLGRCFALLLRLLGPNRYFLLMRYLAHAASIRRQPPL